jgi:hypothetical protein
MPALPAQERFLRERFGAPYDDYTRRGASLAVTGPAVSPVGSRALHGTRNYKSGTACRLSRRRGMLACCRV